MAHNPDRMHVASIPPVRCCLPRLQGGRCCLERKLLTLIESAVVCVVFVCWELILYLSIVFRTLGPLCLLSILPIHCVSYPRPCRL
jgi:hypothetical protein